jgi:FkbM family methyltransferase
LNFSIIPDKSLVGKVLRLPLRLVPARAHMVILQGPLRGKRWIAGSCDHGCWLGSYEYRKQRRFATEVRSGDVIYDLGAHVGFYSLLASALTGPRGRVFSFEPLPINLAVLQQHLNLNGIKNCTVLDVAVSSSGGVANFAAGPTTTMGRLTRESKDAINVRTVVLDDLVGRGELPLPNVIKCDIEGGEYDALEGAARILKRQRPKIFLATHGPDIHRRCCSFLTGHGYKLESLDDLPLDKTSEVLAVPLEYI